MIMRRTVSIVYIPASNSKPILPLWNHKTRILEKIRQKLKSEDPNLEFKQTNRLCLFTITYERGKSKIKIDINVYGICSYFGEILLREYSLFDIRFPMIVIYLKHVIKIKKIKNDDKELEKDLIEIRKELENRRRFSVQVDYFNKNGL